MRHPLSPLSQSLRSSPHQLRGPAGPRLDQRPRVTNMLAKRGYKVTKIEADMAIEAATPCVGPGKR